MNNWKIKLKRKGRDSKHLELDCLFALFSLFIKVMSSMPGEIFLLLEATNVVFPISGLSC